MKTAGKFDFDSFLVSILQNKSQFSKKTGIAPNTCTKWSRNTTDNNISLGMLTKIVKAYPASNIYFYFPSYNNLVLHSKNRK